MSTEVITPFVDTVLLERSVFELLIYLVTELVHFVDGLKGDASGPRYPLRLSNERRPDLNGLVGGLLEIYVHGRIDIEPALVEQVLSVLLFYVTLLTCSVKKGPAQSVFIAFGFRFSSSKKAATASFGFMYSSSTMRFSTNSWRSLARSRFVVRRVLARGLRQARQEAPPLRYRQAPLRLYRSTSLLRPELRTRRCRDRSG